MTPQIHPFPHRYEVRLEGPGGPLGVLKAPPRPDIQGGPPPEFGGTDAPWSPEHLLLSAVSLCFMTTFAAVAAKAQLAVSGYEGTAVGTVDKTPEGLRFTKVVLKVSVRSGEPDKARRLLETAKKHCLVSNSLACPVELDAASGAV